MRFGTTRPGSQQSISGISSPRQQTFFPSAWNVIRTCHLLNKGQGHFNLRAIPSSSGWCLSSSHRDFCYFRIKNPLRPEDEAIRWQITVQPCVHKQQSSLIGSVHPSLITQLQPTSFFFFFLNELNVIVECTLLLLL